MISFECPAVQNTERHLHEMLVVCRRGADEAGLYAHLSFLFLVLGLAAYAACASIYRSRVALWAKSLS